MCAQSMIFCMQNSRIYSSMNSLSSEEAGSLPIQISGESDTTQEIDYTGMDYALAYVNSHGLSVKPITAEDLVVEIRPAALTEDKLPASNAVMSRLAPKIKPIDKTDASQRCCLAWLCCFGKDS